MAWSTEMVTLLRVLINDLATPSVYSNDRLKQLILTGVQLVKADVAFTTTYTFDIDALTLTPDPTTSDPRDNAFINLVLLRSACFLDISELRTQGKKSVRVVDGRSSIDLTQLPNSYKVILSEGACKLYKDALKEYQCGELCPGQAVFGPLSSPNVYTGTTSFNNSNDYERFR